MTTLLLLLIINAITLIIIITAHFILDLTNAKIVISLFKEPFKYSQAISDQIACLY